MQMVGAYSLSQTVYDATPGTNQVLIAILAIALIQLLLKATMSIVFNVVHGTN